MGNPDMAERRRFFELVWAGCSEELKPMLAESPELANSRYKGLSPLGRALENGHKEVAELLIERGADVNAEDFKGSPLYHAVRSGRKDIVDLVVGRGADTRHPIAELAAAVELGHVELVRWLLDLGAVAECFAPGRVNITMLELAAQNGHAEVARILVEAGARHGSCNGKSALHYASSREVAGVLLETGGWIERVHVWGESALQGARDGALELLLEKGPNVNIKCFQGWTPLHSHAAAGNEHEVEILLDHGAEINAVSDKGETPLHLAVATGALGTAGLLLRRGADPNVRDSKNRTPLAYAKKLDESVRAPMVELLKSSGTKR
jgi:ankyrin repeat protein